MNVENPFPPLIFRDKFKFNQQHVTVAKEILSSVRGRNSYLESGNAESSVANQSNPPHRHHAFSDFFNWLDEKANSIILHHYKLSQFYNYKIGNSWVNVHRNGGQTLNHNHGISVLSCVAYITLPINSGFTEFKDPHYDLRSLHERSDGDFGLKEWCSVEASEGDVLFFPGWLQHRSQPNNSNAERWILSANYINSSFAKTLTIKDLF